MNYKEFLSNINPRLKNPYFWIGVVGLVFSASGIDASSLTSWGLLGEALLSICSNPVSIAGIVVSIMAMWNNNETKGFDVPKLYDDMEFRDR